MGRSFGVRTARIKGMILLSWRHLKSRWLESLLIVLGITLGVGVFTAVETLLRFSSDQMEAVYRSNLNLATVQIRPHTLDMSQFYGEDPVPAIPIPPEMADPVELTLDDLKEVRREFGNRVRIALGGSMSSGFRIMAVDDQPLPETGDEQMLQLSYTTPDRFDVAGWEIVAGRAYTWEEFEAAERAIVLTEESASELFPDLPVEDVPGHTVSARSGPVESGRFTIVGVVDDTVEDAAPMRPRRGDGLYGYMPFTAGSEHLVSMPIYGLNIMPVRSDELETIVAEVQSYFDQVYGAGRVRVINPLERRTEMLESQRKTSIAVLVLSGLALVIAAVNVLNLFTARVIKRQRLIGMSRALGAERSTVFWQQCTDALVLGFWGSLGGLLLAHGLTRLIRTLLEAEVRQYGGTNMFAELGLGLSDIALGLGLGVGISIVFGLYPAFLASRQELGHALRAE